MKALNLLVELREVDYREFGASKEDLKVYDEAIAELEEAMKPKSCDGCKFNYDIDNFDSIDGKRLDSVSPNECYMCSRNMQDRFEPKDTQ